MSKESQYRFFVSNPDERRIDVHTLTDSNSVHSMYKKIDKGKIIAVAYELHPTEPDWIKVAATNTHRVNNLVIEKALIEKTPVHIVETN